MIIYFTDRQMDVLGSASTSLPKGLSIIYDNKTEDIDTGVAIFECEVAFDNENERLCESCCEVGNYILRNNDNENEFYTITDYEKDSKKQKIYVYAEDSGLDLLNEIVGAYEADKAYSLEYYVNKFSYDSGFEIGINEAVGLTRKLSWDGEATAAERIRSVATQFDNCEISYSFDIENLQITHKYINIYKKRGKDEGIQLRLNKEIDRIITKKSIKNLATALEVTGGTPEDAENPITLKGYTYDDGDFYVSGSRLYSREALKKWSRYVWTNEPNQSNDLGHIVRSYSYDTTSQKELCTRSISELKKLCEIEVNYEVDISTLPDNVKIGDTVNIIDDRGELYLSTRLLKLEHSITDNEHKATLGEFLIKEDGISQTVKDLASQFALEAQSAKKALEIAKAAQVQSDAAKTQADSALSEANSASKVASAAQGVANQATASAQEAITKADAAQSAVAGVQEQVTSLETTVTSAKAAADNAVIAANTAKEDAATAKTQAAQAVTNANEAKEAATNAQTSANSAVSKADDAIATASTAKTTAETASTTANAAKADAEQAQKDIDALSDNLTTLENTMKADYARKTDLTETEASLQTQITQNAADISSTASKVQVIDETANNAKELANQASLDAASAQSKADAATSEAAAAQTAADEAKTAAANAQTNANNAKAAAENAQAVASQAETDLAAAKADLATVTSRVDATEEDIAAAELKVQEAQAAADKAKTDAATAVTNAANAQSVADTAAANATAAQETADNAAANAELAVTAANEAKANASAAQTKANEAAATAATAQETANTAKTNAAAAQSAADAADAKAQQAATDLATAQANLDKVTSDLSSTQEEVEAAQAAVVAAQQAADTAKANAAAAQSTADTAKANAATAQTAANNAKTAADNAQLAADAAQQAADQAQADADSLKVRMTSAETSIKQNADAIALAATKTEVEQTLGGYYTKTETDAQIKVASDNITSQVSSTYTTKNEFNSLENRVSSAESSITQNADNIALKVSKDGIISAINQSAESVTIEATKINLSGYLTIANASNTYATQESLNTVKSAADAANTAIAAWCYNNNTTYIDGAKIYTGTITANQIASNAITAEKLNVTSLSAISSNLGSVTAGSININDRFIVDGGGNLTSKSGYIAGWQINQTNLTSPTKTSGTMQSVSQINPYGFYNERYDSGFDVANLYTIEMNDGEISFWEKTRKSDGDYVLNQLQIMGRNINNFIYDGTTTIGNEESLVSMQSIVFNDDGGIDIWADGEITMNGMRFGVNKILATPAWYMKADQTVNLSESVSSQPHGIVLVWSAYTSGEGPKNYDWYFGFVPKYHINIANGSGCFFINPYKGMYKYVYIHNTKIVGNSNNYGKGTSNGISYDGAKYVLRYVVGV